jgi:dTMP kinase
MRGDFVVFEGPDGSGKSTQARLLAEHLDAILTFEPGGTPLGNAVRQWLLDPDMPKITGRAEALLFAGARAQHVQDVIVPALTRGQTVVCDRYIHSSLAYQGAGREYGTEAIGGMSEWATQGLWPDVVIYLDVSDEYAAQMLAQRRDKQDRLDGEAKAFHKRTNQAFRSFAKDDPAGCDWLVIDGVGSIEDVAKRVIDAYDGWHMSFEGLPLDGDWNS